ncbi:MAG: hypothetical protein J6Y80_04455 [Victivallales bacterium]|nr:hypothetical protein [Victivallales bacterium]
MFLLIDTASLPDIRRALELYPLAGVTTCPTIITREHRPFWELLGEIRAIIGEDRMLHAQVIGRTAKEILQDAVALRDRVPGNFYVKVPVTLEGLKAMPLLRREGIPFTATTIHTLPQAILAAEHGASFLAPYINHIEDEGIAGTEFIRQVVEYLERNRLPAKLLAASFRNTRQIMSVLTAGAHHATLAPELLWKLADSPMTDQAVEKYRQAWDETYGADKNLANLDH